MSAGRVEGLVAVITGAGSGIGAATAGLLASEGASVVVADIEAENGERVVESICSNGGRAIAVATDMGVPEQIERLIGRAVDEYGRLDILHNNAAAMNLARADPQVTEIDLADWNQALAVNLTGPMLASKYAIPHMVKVGGGSIVHTASVEAIRSTDAHSGYSSTKAGLLGLSRSIAVQYGKAGIRSNAVLPGPTISEETEIRLGPELHNVFKDHVMSPTTSRPKDQASVVLFLASPESWFVNGETITVDGALTRYLPFVPRLRQPR